MPIQFYMRGFNTATSQYVDWVVNDQPDTLGTYSGVDPLDLSNITINRLVTSKVDNFLKPSSPDYLKINTAGGPFLFHLNSYDWLNPNSSGDPAIPVPSNLVGISVNRGTSDNNYPEPTPREYASIVWEESSSSWKFGFLNSSGALSSLTSIAFGNLTVNGYAAIDDYVAIGTEPVAQSGLLRLPNSASIIARDAGDTTDLSLISSDSSDRVVIGSSLSSVYLPTSQIVDNFISESSASGGSLTNTSQSGFIRLKNNTAGIAFRTLSSTDSYLLATDSSDQVFIGDLNNNGIFYSTGSSGAHVFSVNGNVVYGVYNDGIYFDDTLLDPKITQFERSVGSGQNLTISAQTTTSVSGYGGSNILKSGSGPLGDGYVDIKSGNKLSLRSYGLTSPVVTDYTQNSSLNTDSIVIFNKTLRFYNNLPSGANISFDPIDSSFATSQPFTISAQSNIGISGTGGDLLLSAGDATGVTSNGGNLVLSSGAGTSTNGNILLKSSGNTVAQVSDNKLETKRGRRRNITSTFVTTNNYVITNDNDVVVVDSTISALTIKLPPSPAAGDTYDIKDGVGIAATNNITVDGNGNTIDGFTTIPLAFNYSSVTLIYNGTEWNII